MEPVPEKERSADQAFTLNGSIGIVQRATHEAKAITGTDIWKIGSRLVLGPDLLSG